MFDQLSRPLRDLRISVIDRCNFRCTYCMPSDKFNHTYKFLDQEEWLTFDDIIRLVRIFVNLGVRKIRLTGGEPLLRPELCNLIKSLAVLPGIEDLTLTTNGSLLKKYAAKLKNSGLHRITVSLDTLDDDISKTMNGERGSVREILEGIHEAHRVGFASIKINAVIQRGVNDHTILDLIEYFRFTPHIVRFIEFMDVGNHNHWQIQNVVSSKEVLKIIHQKFPLQKINQAYDSEVAERFVFQDQSGEIGFISSVTEPFCGSCSRVRLSADGKLYTCLFAQDSVDVRKFLREGADDDEIRRVIIETWLKRRDQYSQERFKNQNTSQRLKVEMHHIGG